MQYPKVVNLEFQIPKNCVWGGRILGKFQPSMAGNSPTVGMHVAEGRHVYWRQLIVHILCGGRWKAEGAECCQCLF